MSDPRCIHPAPACLPSGETGDLFTARSQRRPRQPKPKGHPLAAVVCALLVGITSGTTAIARGGHGMGGFGIHGHAGGREGFLTPAYVLITISKITDAEAFKATMQDLITTTRHSLAAWRRTWTSRYPGTGLPQSTWRCFSSKIPTRHRRGRTRTRSRNSTMSCTEARCRAWSLCKACRRRSPMEWNEVAGGEETPA